MSIIDALLGAAILLFYLLRLRTSLPLLAVMILVPVQFAIEGPVWQFIPAYILIPITIFFPLPAYVIAAFPLLAACPWILLSVPVLPKPPGPHPLATHHFRLTDLSRPEVATIDPNDHRSVIFQAWYPINNPQDQPHSTYMDALGRLPKSVGFLPRFLFNHFDRINTHATDTPPSKQPKRKWPVLIFSPGYGAIRAVYTALITNLASRGYIVLALDHPYEAAVAELPNGTLATPIERFQSNDPNQTAYMTEHLNIRAADLAFVLSRLPHLPQLSSHFDLTRITAIGHSFGGATALLALHNNPNLNAAVNIDGTLYGEIVAQRLNRPILIIQSDPEVTHHSRKFTEGNLRLLAQSPSTSKHLTLPATNHYSFTDLPYYLSPPGRLLAALILKGCNNAADTQQLTATAIEDFLNQNPQRPAFSSP